MTRRHGINLLIVAVLVFELVMPLRYYLGGDGNDERFSWRMFSSVRMQECRVEITEIVRKGSALEARIVDPRETLQATWVRLLERGRPAVIEQFLARRCARPEVADVRYRRTCTEAAGASGRRGRVVRDCGSGQVVHALDPTRG